MKIYILCPGFHKTGGTELAHQLCASLKKRDVDASMVYFDSGDGLEINPAFSCYVESAYCIDEIADSEKQLVIIPEVAIEFVQHFPKSKKAIWWMSVDNFRLLYDSKFKVSIDGFWRGVKHFLLKKRLNYFDLVRTCEWHLYQSEYARQFVIGLGIDPSRLMRLGDYVNEDYLKGRPTHFSATLRRQRVLYNPAKGYAFTKQLINSAPDIDWTPLRGFTNAQLVKLMRTSMVYVDFGNHPGKDRMPREAAVSGCCVIAGLKGAACFYEDVPISNQFKFDVSSDNVQPIIQKIRYVLQNYDVVIENYDNYRELIAQEPELFEKDVDSFLIQIKD